MAGRSFLQGSLLALVLLGCDGRDPLGPSASSARVAAPTTLTATAVSFDRIDLAWQDNASNESGWEVHRSTTGAGGTFALYVQLGPNSTASANTGLQASTEYCYKVRSFRQSGRRATYGEFSNVACATTLAPPLPAAASGVNATPRFGYAIGVTWIDNSSNETGFRVERSAVASGPWNVLGTVGANVTSRDEYPVYAAEEQSCYRVFAFNSFGDSDTSNVDCTTPPAAPTNLAATVALNGTVDLAWTDNSGVEDGFVVLRGRNGAEDMRVVATLPANSTAYSDVGLPDSSYGYAVRATRDGGTSLNGSNFVQAVVATVPPNAPTDLGAWPTGSTLVTVAFVDVAMNEEWTRVERSTDGGMTWVTVANLGFYLLSPWVTDITASEQQACYRAIAFNRVGDSPASNTSCTAPPAAPTGFTATPVDSVTIDFAWTDNSNVEDGYAIGAVDDFGYYWELFAYTASDATSYRLVADRPYYANYFVVATRDGGYSDWSNVVFVTPPSGAASARRP
jgi:titin